MKFSTTLGHINKIPNSIYASVVKEFYEYLKEIGTSENYQNQNLKQIIGFAKIKMGLLDEGFFHMEKAIELGGKEIQDMINEDEFMKEVKDDIRFKRLVDKKF